MRFEGKRLERAMEELSLDAQGLADITGLPKSVIYSYLSDAVEPGCEALAMIAKALGLLQETFFCPDRPMRRTEKASRSSAA